VSRDKCSDVKSGLKHFSYPRKNIPQHALNGMVLSWSTGTTLPFYLTF